MLRNCFNDWETKNCCCCGFGTGRKQVISHVDNWAPLALIDFSSFQKPPLHSMCHRPDVKALPVTPNPINHSRFFPLNRVRRFFLSFTETSEFWGFLSLHHGESCRAIGRSHANGVKSSATGDQKSLPRRNFPQISENSPRNIFSVARDLPAHDRVFHIFSSRIIMANKCDKSPANRNTFILCVLLDLN